MCRSDDAAFEPRPFKASNRLRRLSIFIHAVFICARGESCLDVATVRSPSLRRFPMLRNQRFISAALTASLVLLASSSVLADGNLQKVHHIIIVMQENHSFDNYFGALAYAPGSPYHNGNGSCSSTDHTC